MKTSLLFRVGATLLLGFVSRSLCLPIESVPYKGAVDYAGYPATDPSKAYPQPPAPVFPLGFQPTGKPVLRINTDVGKTVPVIPPLPKGWPDNLSPLSSSGSSTLISPSTPGGRPQPRRQQTLYEAKNRPPTPFARPAPKKQATLPAGHWHPSMGMGPRPVTPTEPFIPPGFSDKKPNPNQAASKPSPPKKPTNGYEADNEKGRLRKTKGLAAPGYGSDSDSPSPKVGGNKSVPRKTQVMKAIPGGSRKDSARPSSGGTPKRGKVVSPPPARPKPGVAKPPAKKAQFRAKAGVKPKAATSSKRQK